MRYDNQTGDQGVDRLHLKKAGGAERSVENEVPIGCTGAQGSPSPKAIPSKPSLQCQGSTEQGKLQEGPDGRSPFIKTSSFIQHFTPKESSPPAQ